MPIPSTILDLSTTAASNSPAGSETVGPNLDNYLRSIEAIIRQESENKSWERWNQTPTYISANSFSVTGDQTAIYTVRRRLKFTVSGSPLYGIINSSVFGSVTTVTVTLDSGALTAGLTEVQLGEEPNAISLPLADFGFRNKLINGAMKIDQRNAGAAQTFTAGAALAYSVDRWYGFATGANITGQRIAVSAQNRYRFTGAASNSGVGFGQRIKAANSMDLAGTVATLQVKLSSSSLTSITWAAYYANSADAFGTLASPTRTSIATGSFTITSTEATYSTQITVPSAATTGIEIVFTGGALLGSQTLTIGDVQLEAGAIAQTFEARLTETEKTLCMAYGEPLSNGFMGATISTTSADFAAVFKMEKHTTPSITQVDTAPSIRISGSTTSDIAGTISSLGTDTKAVYVQFTRTSGTWTANLPAFVNQSSGTVWLFADAEL